VATIRHLDARKARATWHGTADLLETMIMRLIAALTEMLVDKIIIKRYPSKIDKDGRRHYLICAIPYQDPQQEAERLKATHDARVKIVPSV
jgi:hypothetical protein